VRTEFLRTSALRKTCITALRGFPTCLPTPFVFIYIHRCSLLGDFDYVATKSYRLSACLRQGPLSKRLGLLHRLRLITAPSVDLGTLPFTVMIPAFNGVFVFLQCRCRLSLCPLYPRSEGYPGSASKARCKAVPAILDQVCRSTLLKCRGPQAHQRCRSQLGLHPLQPLTVSVW